jgi:hypothetical protein
MMAEAIRLSLADEEERRKKAEKEARKEAKKREKEERKVAKKKGDVYGGGSPSGSSLSLGLGRRRGNSAASNLRMEASVAAANTVSSTQGSEPGSPTYDKGKGVERGVAEETSPTTSSSLTTLPIPTPQVPRGLSHLRQMSNASSISISSSGVDSMPGSYAGKNLGAGDPHGSALSLGQQSDQGDSGSTEPLFNFRSLAEVVGVSIDGEGSQSEESNQGHEAKTEDHGGTHGEHVEHAVDPSTKPTVVTSKAGQSEIKETIMYTRMRYDGSTSPPPDVVVTPDTPAPLDSDDEDSKRLGHFDLTRGSREVI